MSENDFRNIEYHGAQKALKEKMRSKLFEARDLAETAGYEDYALLMDKTGLAIQLLMDVQELHNRVLSNKAKRAGEA